MDTFAIRHLTFSYPGQTRRALDDCSLTVGRGEFVVLCGPSGCGKSTLLRHLKTALAPHGRRSGTILFEGTPLDELDQRAQSGRIGFVQQSPDNQLVTDKVWHELAFGLESLGYDTPAIRRRVAEMACFFGLEDWFYRDVAALSGGQKQLLNLAAVMALQPDALVLDEPTAQLDPIAAADFLATLGRINRELGTTILLSEHRLEEVFPLADAAAVMDRGRLLAAGTPRAVGEALRETNGAVFLAMPTPMRVWAAVEDAGAPCPVTVREGREWLGAVAERRPLGALPPEPVRAYAGAPVLCAEDLWFRYGKDLPDTVKGLRLRVHRGELLALLGGNGAGKTTSLRLLAGALKPDRGEVRAAGRVGMLPQDPRTLFVHRSVREELYEMAEEGLPAGERDRWVGQAVGLCRLEGLLERHPYDLSGGERQRAALAKVLLAKPEILLLDEPTKGLDAQCKLAFARILEGLLDRGTAILMVSHDVEFCARHAHRCALLFDGAVVTQSSPRAFFSGSYFYTTFANRMARDLLPGAVTPEDLIHACGGAPAPAPAPAVPESPEPEREPAPACPPAPLRAGGRSGTRGRLAAGLVLLLIPLTLWAGQRYLGQNRYALLCLLILLEAMLPFFLAFEGRRPQGRELVVLAVLCAIGTAARAALAPLPQCKPVLALTVLAGAAFGGESGFLVGALTMLVSNMLFAQGPWTPWQMFAMGAVGFLAGVLFCRRRRRTPLALGAFGAAASVAIYGGIMNFSAAVMAAPVLRWDVVAVTWLAGLPADCVQAAATGLFLWLAARPLLEVLERVKTKYGLGQ